ncbi:MAG: discoidin domain-containing protein [Deltaproteobacteria bacterium]|nr:discoidin domain-containing protein [Deltaproteobacteria bacterium]
MGAVRWWAWIAMALIWTLLKTPTVVAQTVLDTFEDLSEWKASADDGAHIEIAPDAGRNGMGMRIDFDFQSGGRFVMVRKAFNLTLPTNYAFKLWIRGVAPNNNLEFKLIDRSGQNVWWYNQRGYQFPADWRHVAIKDPRIHFAWGPLGGGPPKQIAFIEIAISAATGGKGSIWIDDLEFEQRRVEKNPDEPPKVSASTSLPDHGPELLLDGNSYTVWSSGPVESQQWVLIDFGRPREYGGLVIDWDPDDYAVSYQLQASDDGQDWTQLFESTRCHGGRSYIYTPDAESRYLRLELAQSSRAQGYGIRAITVKPYELVASPNQFFEAIANETFAGSYPKYYAGRQTYWTVIGVPADGKIGIINAEGLIEPAARSFSVEPFLYFHGQLITWDDGVSTQSLENGYLPVPSVYRLHDTLGLLVTALASKLDGGAGLYVRYRVENHSEASEDVTLYLTLRPFQVLPPWQNLNLVGGVTSINEIVFDARTVLINGDPALVAQTPPDRFGSAAFDEGSVTDFLLQGKLPPRVQTSDPLGYASAALEYVLHLPPHGSRDIYIALPQRKAGLKLDRIIGDDAATQFDKRLGATTSEWTTRLSRVDLQLPTPAMPAWQTLHSALAHILATRDNAALHPGPRTYARSWIRDGAIMSTALLQMGFPSEVRDFIRWYAPFQAADGRVPCCVDSHGPDNVIENDSNGELIYTIAEYYRFTRDIGLVSDLWPAIVHAVESLADLRRQRMTEAYKRADKHAFFGLLPESISHEGYSSRPVHSYWDDFWALRGLKDAASLALIVGDNEHAVAFATLRDAFRSDLYASLNQVIRDHKLDYIPGSVELADFDPNATAIAVGTVGELQNLPQPALRRTFDRYWDIVQKRESDTTWEAYTPYELRNVEAFVRLGQRDRANALLQRLLDDRRPLDWNQWPEILWHDANLPRFIGDMPHTWIGATFVKSLRSFFAYEREADHALVLAAGIPGAWVQSDKGVTVKRLPTHYGVLSYRLRSDGANAMAVTITGDLDMPPGKIIVQPPLPRPLRAVTINGRAVDDFAADQVAVGEFPADLRFEY